MNKEQLYKALDLIDPDIVEEFIVEESRLQRNVQKRRTLIKYARAAACLCVLVIIYVAAINMYSPPSSNGNDSAPPLGMGTVTTEKEPQDGTASPGADLSYTFIYNEESYTVSAYDKILINDDAAYLGVVMLTENGQDVPTLESRVFSLPDGSLAVEINGNYYRASKNSK